MSSASIAKSETPTSGKIAPPIARMTRSPRNTLRSLGKGGTPSEPAGRRFHHIAAAETASRTMAAQAARRMARFSQPKVWPMCVLMPHSSHLPKGP